MKKKYIYIKRIFKKIKINIYRKYLIAKCNDDYCYNCYNCSSKNVSKCKKYFKKYKYIF